MRLIRQIWLHINGTRTIHHCHKWIRGKNGNWHTHIHTSPAIRRREEKEREVCTICVKQMKITAHFVRQNNQANVFGWHTNTITRLIHEHSSSKYHTSTRIYEHTTMNYGFISLCQFLFWFLFICSVFRRKSILKTLIATNCNGECVIYATETVWRREKKKTKKENNTSYLFDSFAFSLVINNLHSPDQNLRLSATKLLR